MYPPTLLSGPKFYRVQQPVCAIIFANGCNSCESLPTGPSPGTRRATSSISKSLHRGVWPSDIYVVGRDADVLFSSPPSSPPLAEPADDYEADLFMSGGGTTHLHPQISGKHYYFLSFSTQLHLSRSRGNRYNLQIPSVCHVMGSRQQPPFSTHPSLPMPSRLPFGPPTAAA